MNPIDFITGIIVGWILSVFILSVMGHFLEENYERVFDSEAFDKHIEKELKRYKSIYEPEGLKVERDDRQIKVFKDDFYFHIYAYNSSNFYKKVRKQNV